MLTAPKYNLLDFFQFLIYIPYYFIWWYGINLIQVIKFIWRTVMLIGDSLSIGPMLGNLFQPYHQDRTFIGRFMGFILRLFWIVTSGIFFVVSLVLLLFIIPIYLMWPVGFYFGMMMVSYFTIPWQQNMALGIGWLITLSSVLIYLQYYVLHPKKSVKTFQNINDFSVTEIEKTFMNDLKRDWMHSFRLASADSNLEELSYYLFLAAILNKRNAPIFYRLNLIPRLVYKEAKAREAEMKSSFIPLDQLFAKMIEEAVILGHEHLDSDVLLVSLVKYNKAIHDFFIKLGITAEELEGTSLWIYEKIKKRSSWKYWKQPHFRIRGGYDRAWTSAWTPTLRHFSQNITAMVSQGRIPPVIGRKKEIDQIIQILTRTTKNNVMLLGPAGVGKTAIVYGIAQRMLTGEVIELKNKKLVSIDFPSMLGGTGARGDFEARFKQSLEESGPGQTILFVDEIGSVIHTGGGAGGIDAAAILMPYLSDGSIQLVGTSTYADYRKNIEKDVTFASFFQTVEIPEPSKEDAMQILENVSSTIEHRQEVSITFQAIEASVLLSKQYMRDRMLPEKAIDILDETSVAVRRKGKQIVTNLDVAEVISSKTGIPVGSITQSEREKLLGLEKKLKERVIGQVEAIEAISNAMRRARVGLKSSDKPIAKFLFLGPTGVGKTETCKALAEQYYGSEKQMIRLDMSEYQDGSSIARLLGAPPGSPDFEAGGQLTEAVRHKPFSLVLLDELEKANPRILDIFLQVLDDGRLTDSSGRVVSFNESIIIATSNAQAVLIQESVRKGVPYDQLKELVFQNLTQQFKPEFINRFDAVVVYHPLTMEEVLQIAVLMMQELRKSLKEKEIGFEITPEALLKVAKIGYNPEFGARPLHRAIQDRIENKVAERILLGEVKAGDVIKIEEKDI